MKITEKQNFNCEICLQGKMTSFHNRSPDERATKPLEFVHHIELAGPVNPTA